MRLKPQTDSQQTLPKITENYKLREMTLGIARRRQNYLQKHLSKRFVNGSPRAAVRGAD
jgi:hypothetical protein